MLIMSRPLSEMLLLKLELTAFWAGGCITFGHWTFARWNRGGGSVIGDAGILVLGSRERNTGGLTGACVRRCCRHSKVILANDCIDMMLEKRDDFLRQR